MSQSLCSCARPAPQAGNAPAPRPLAHAPVGAGAALAVLVLCDGGHWGAGRRHLGRRRSSSLRLLGGGHALGGMAPRPLGVRRRLVCGHLGGKHKAQVSASGRQGAKQAPAPPARPPPLAGCGRSWARPARRVQLEVPGRAVGTGRRPRGGGLHVRSPAAGCRRTSVPATSPAPGAAAPPRCLRCWHSPGRGRGRRRLGPVPGGGDATEVAAGALSWASHRSAFPPRPARPAPPFLARPKSQKRAWTAPSRRRGWAGPAVGRATASSWQRRQGRPAFPGRAAQAPPQSV